jgi:hypothetical protein
MEAIQSALTKQRISLDKSRQATMVTRSVTGRLMSKQLRAPAPQTTTDIIAITFKQKECAETRCDKYCF